MKPILRILVLALFCFVITLVVMEYKKRNRILSENPDPVGQIDELESLRAMNDDPSSSYNLATEGPQSSQNNEPDATAKPRGEAGALPSENERTNGLVTNNPTIPFEPGLSNPAIAWTSNKVEKRLRAKDYKFLGYATPENSLKSLLWATAHGNLEAFLSNLTPETRQKVADAMQAGASAHSITQSFNQGIANQWGLLIVDKKWISDTEVVLYVDGDITRPGIVMKKVDEEWKFSDIDKNGLFPERRARFRWSKER